MENIIRDLFNTHNILEIAAGRYGIHRDEISDIGGFQNFVYEYQQYGKSYILRITPGMHRTPELVSAELEWIKYLARNGISASEPIRSINQAWTEVIRTPEMPFTAVSFNKAPGSRINYPECLNDNATYEQLGQLTGRMHALSKQYKVQNPALQRHHWHHNYFLQNIDILPASHQRVRECYYSIVDTLRKLPKDIDSYGLIHSDMGFGNFMVNDQSVITLFDFDEAQYSWFVEDIAIQLYYLVYVYGGDTARADREEQALRFMQHFMSGYSKENILDKYWLEQIPHFLKLRELIVYIGAFRNFDGDETFSSSDNEWYKDWIRDSRGRLENNLPIVNVW
ncbi:phosphotransferase [Paenibacillus sp. MMS20-IR301]|uniref:phosphotransferase enzyme family protein n=1 Tax=Paenibacillus sp. MMS20-IR301 TaxID=2895946 RepID=UPI0028E19223|nr:phosphotransferase [Paenibacillus sp. MMS20-IR301]WNS44716.1 phosphotransferase [Paenibacillus sp. MMS20-IR301]